MTTLSNALPSLLVDCFMGGWSDMFGRKLPMFLPALGGLLSSIVYILVVSFQSLGVEWLCLASFLSGGTLVKASTLTDSVPKSFPVIGETGLNWLYFQASLVG